MIRSHPIAVALVLVVVLGVAASASAHEFKIGQIGVATPWARATIGAGKTGVVYLTVHNRGTATDRLIAVSTPIAKRAALHTHKMDKGVMRMHPVETIELAQGKTIVLAPGGTHIMLMGLKYPLREGGTFPLTLTFAEAGSATIAIDIQSATAAGGHAHKSGHGKTTSKSE